MKSVSHSSDPPGSLPGGALCCWQVGFSITKLLSLGDWLGAGGSSSSHHVIPTAVKYSGSPTVTPTQEGPKEGNSVCCVTATARSASQALSAGASHQPPETGPPPAQSRGPGSIGKAKQRAHGSTARRSVGFELRPPRLQRWCASHCTWRSLLSEAVGMGIESGT